MASTLVLVNCSRTKDSVSTNHKYEPAEACTRFLPQVRRSVHGDYALGKLGVQVGADFGSLIEGFNSTEPIYKEAHVRYRGSVFPDTREAHWIALEDAGYHVVILSALYGAVRPFERIQNYDLMLTHTLMEYWQQAHLSKHIAAFAALRQCTRTLFLLTDLLYMGMLNTSILPPSFQQQDRDRATVYGKWLRSLAQ